MQSWFVDHETPAIAAVTRTRVWALLILCSGQQLLWASFKFSANKILMWVVIRQTFLHYIIGAKFHKRNMLLATKSAIKILLEHYLLHDPFSKSFISFFYLFDRCVIDSATMYVLRRSDTKASCAEK